MRRRRSGRRLGFRLGRFRSWRRCRGNGKLFFLRLGRIDDAVGERLFFLGLCKRSGFGARAGVGLDLDQHRSDRDLVADFAGQFDDGAGDRAFHFDRRLVGHHVGQLLVFLDPIADLDVPGDDFGLGNAFANVGELEFVDAHAAMTFLRAVFIRIGPGK